MLNATVLKRIEITDNLVIFLVKPDHAIPDFLPGQYVALGLLPEAPRPASFAPEKEAPKPGKLIKRSYSVGSSPAEKGCFEFYVAIVPEGALTSRMALLREGDRIYCAQKVAGTFTLAALPEHANLVMVSTGTGIAPFMSMLRTSGTWTAGRKITLIHGARYAHDLAYRDELLELERTSANFLYYATISRDDPAWNGHRGYVQEFFRKGMVAVDPEVDHIFVCGNPAMIADVRETVGGRGYSARDKRNPAGNLHVEEYW